MGNLGQEYIYIASMVWLFVQSVSQAFYKVDFTLSDIIEWGEESAFAIGEKFEMFSKSGDIQKSIYSGKGVCINYLVHGSMLPVVDYELLKERIEIEQHGIVEISFENEEKIEKFITIFEKLKRFIEISSFRKNNVEKVSACSKDIVYAIGEKTLNDR